MFVPGQQKEKMLEHCSEWELLNLRIDDICTLTDNVVNHITSKNPKAESVKSTLDKALEVCLTVYCLRILNLRLINNSKNGKY